MVSASRRYLSFGDLVPSSFRPRHILLNNKIDKVLKKVLVPESILIIYCYFRLSEYIKRQVTDVADREEEYPGISLSIHYIILLICTLFNATKILVLFLH